MTLPPLGAVEWLDANGRPARRAGAARRLMGELPRGPFEPEALAPGLERVFRGDLFASAWPRFRSDQRTTRLTIDVEENPPLEIQAAGGFNSDVRQRITAAILLRPTSRPWPALTRVGGTVRRFGRQTFAGIEPRALGRGASGFFLRGGARRMDVRIFDPAREITLDRVDRAEGLAGGQVPLGTGDVVQGGIGVARVWERGRTRQGALGALRSEAPGRWRRYLDVAAMGGPDGYVAARSGVSWELRRRIAIFRNTVAAAWASEEAPADELSGVGGPASLAGLRQDEWLGRSRLAYELRALRYVTSGFDVHAFAQVAEVGKAISRKDLSARPHFAGGLGVFVNLPFGPIAVDWGISERGAYRLEASVGQRF